MNQLDYKFKQLGYSDIRMWPCYMVMCVLVLLFNKWLGLFWATVLVGLPAFYLSLRMFKLYDPSKAPVKSEAVHAEIERMVLEYEESNFLLRRNMKIIQDDEKEQQENKKTYIFRRPVNSKIP